MGNIFQKNKFTLAVFLGVIIASLIGAGTISAEAVKIGGNGYSCTNAVNRWKTESSATATLPAGYTFESIIVKSGQDCIEVFPTNTLPLCYEIALNGNEVVVTKIGDGNECKDISHLQGTYTITTSPSPSADPNPSPSTRPSHSPSPTPTPSRSPHVSPSPHPSPSPSFSPNPSCPPGTDVCIICPGGGECEVCIGDNCPSPTPSPTPTESPTPTPSSSPTPTPSSSPTPTPSSGNSGDSGGGGGDGGQAVGGPTGQVLGASTLAAAGSNYSEILSLFSIALGSIITLKAAHGIKKAQS